jgi:hypothetical protein
LHDIDYEWGNKLEAPVPIEVVLQNAPLPHSRFWQLQFVQAYRAMIKQSDFETPADVIKDLRALHASRTTARSRIHTHTHTHT